MVVHNPSPATDLTSVTNDTKYIYTTNIGGSPSASSVCKLVQDILTNTYTIIATAQIDALGTTWFVDSAMAVSGDGKTPETAFKTIQEGHDAASSGDTVIVKQGTYDENVNTTGLTVTKSNLRFLAAPPFQVTIHNTNVAATHAVYLNTVSNVSFDNFVFTTDFSGAYGLEINNSSSVLCTISNCATVGCYAGIRLGGSYCYVKNCFSLFDKIGVEALSGATLNFVLNYLAITLFVAPPTNGLLFDSGSTLTMCKDVQCGGFSSAIESGGGSAVIETLRLAANTVNVTDPGTNTFIADYQVQSKIGTNTSLQDDMKSLYDDTKFILTNAITGATAGSVADNSQYLNTTAISSPTADTVNDNVQYLKTLGISSPTSGSIADNVQYLTSVALGTPTAGSIGSKVTDIANDTSVLVAGLYLQTGSIWYCDSTVGASGDGTSPSTAFKTIQEGHDAASTGDVIVVASGTYIENVNVEGLKVTTSGLKFIAKEPFQVTVLNNNVGATSTVYINANYVSFNNFVTAGDMLLGGCARGWMIDSTATLCQLNSCAGYLHSDETFYLSGTYPVLESCMAVLTGVDATTYAYYLAAGSVILKHCTAAGGEQVNAYGVYVAGGSYHQIVDCHMNYYGTGFYSAGQREAFTNCSALNCGTSWNLSGDAKMANSSESSLIGSALSLSSYTVQKDLKAVWDDTKYLYTTALDGSEVADSIGDFVKDINTTVGAIPAFGVCATGTLNDANTSDEITTASGGAKAFIGISLEHMANGDDFDLQLQRWDGAAWRNYVTYNVTKTAGVISIDSGSGETTQTLDEISFENIYLDSTRKLQLVYTKNSATDRDFHYFVNLEE